MFKKPPRDELSSPKSVFQEPLKQAQNLVDQTHNTNLLNMLQKCTPVE